MNSEGQFLLSVYCKARLNQLREDQLQEHANLLIDRLEELLTLKLSRDPNDPWVGKFVNEQMLQLDLEEGKN